MESVEFYPTDQIITKPKDITLDEWEKFYNYTHKGESVYYEDESGKIYEVFLNRVINAVRLKNGMIKISFITFQIVEEYFAEN